MNIQFFNIWYFFFIALSLGGFAGLYLLLRNRSQRTVKAVLIALMAFALVLHFMKGLFPPYSLDYDRHLRDSWFINICGANIALFPFMLVSKNKYVKDYMFYIGMLSGLIALFYPQEPLAKVDQLGEFWDIVRFYYHHWMVMAVPLLMALFGIHRPSYKRVFSAPIGLLLLMLFIMLNQLFQSELGFIPLRSDDMFNINYKNTSYIWGPGTNDAIGEFLALFCPDFFRIIPVGEFAGQVKYWPWFWMIFPAFILVTPLAFGLSMVFDAKTLAADVRKRLGYAPQENKLHAAK